MSERKQGWYWVSIASGTWEVAEWAQGRWWTLWDEPGDGIDDALARDSDMDKIGPRIPSPDEPWQTVPTEPTQEMIDAAMYRAGESDVPRGSESWRAMGQVIKFAHEAAPSTGEDT